MPTYDIEVTRDGHRWWLIHIPALDGLAHARCRGEIEIMARSYIAVCRRINQRTQQDDGPSEAPCHAAFLQSSLRCTAGWFTLGWVSETSHATQELRRPACCMD